MVKEAAYLERYKLLFSQYVDLETNEIIDPEFRKDIEEVRALGEKMEVVGDSIFDLSSPLDYFIRVQYTFPEAMYAFIRHWVMTDKLDYNLIEAGMYLVDDLKEMAIINETYSYEEAWSKYKDYSKGVYPDEDIFYYTNGELKLVIGPDATIDQILDFVRRNKDFIQRQQASIRQDGTRNGRIRKQKNIRRDMRIKELKTEGRKNKEIAEIINSEFSNATISYADIPVILRNLKRQSRKLDNAD